MFFEEDKGMNGYREQLIEWLDVKDWDGWYAVTLTFAQSLPDADGGKCLLSQDVASRNVRHYLNVLNKRFWGNAARKYGRRCQVIPTFEYGEAPKKYLHYHLFIKKPNHVAAWKFECRLRSDWFKTEWGELSVNVQSNTDSGWLEYITKDTRGGKTNPEWNFENVDFNNIWFAG